VSVGSQAGSNGVSSESWSSSSRSRSSLTRVTVGSVNLRMKCLNLENGLQFSKIKTIFQKLKKNIQSNKFFFVDYYFMSHQTPENTENIL
jgi:hypothetical protein